MKCLIGSKTLSGKGVQKLDEKAIEDVTTGQVFTAQQAIKLGLVDKIGFLEDAVSRAATLAGLSEDSVRAVQYKQPQGIFDDLLGGATQARSFNDAGDGCRIGLLPEAWYLGSWWPMHLRQTLSKLGRISYEDSFDQGLLIVCSQPSTRAFPAKVLTESNDTSRLLHDTESISARLSA